MRSEQVIGAYCMELINWFASLMYGSGLRVMEARHRCVFRMSIFPEQCLFVREAQKARSGGRTLFARILCWSPSNTNRSGPGVTISEDIQDGFGRSICQVLGQELYPKAAPPQKKKKKTPPAAVAICFLRGAPGPV